MESIGTHAEARSVAVTKGRAVCGTSVLPWLPQCANLESWKGSVEDSSRAIYIHQIVGFGLFWQALTLRKHIP